MKLERTEIKHLSIALNSLHKTLIELEMLIPQHHTISKVYDQLDEVDGILTDYLERYE